MTEINDKAGRRYFEGSLKFQSTLTKILNMLVRRVQLLAEKDINGAYMSQIWGVVLLVFVMILSPILIVLAKNAISSIQVFAGMYLAKEKRFKKQLYGFIFKTIAISGISTQFLKISIIKINIYDEDFSLFLYVFSRSILSIAHIQSM